MCDKLKLRHKTDNSDINYGLIAFNSPIQLSLPPSTLDFQREIGLKTVQKRFILRGPLENVTRLSGRENHEYAHSIFNTK